MGKILGSIIALVGVYFFLTGFVLGGIFGCLLGILILIVAFRGPTRNVSFVPPKSGSRTGLPSLPTRSCGEVDAVSHGVGCGLNMSHAPNTRLQRTRSAPLRSPLSRKPFGDSLS